MPKRTRPLRMQLFYVLAYSDHREEDRGWDQSPKIRGSDHRLQVRPLILEPDHTNTKKTHFLCRLCYNQEMSSVFFVNIMALKLPQMLTYDCTNVLRCKIIVMELF